MSELCKMSPMLTFWAFELRPKNWLRDLLASDSKEARGSISGSCTSCDADLSMHILPDLA